MPWTHFGVSETVWTAFESQVGSPGSDVRLLAALPRSTVVAGCGDAVTQDGGFTAMQATLGLVWRLARRAMAAQSGVSEESFIDVDPWMEGGDSETGDTVARGQEPRTSSGVKERVLKMSSLIDQHDESELLPPSEGP